MGLTELGTKSPDGYSTGLSHLKELGVTHIHRCCPFLIILLWMRPCRHITNQLGPRSTELQMFRKALQHYPADGITRIKELKQMIQTFHNNGLRVIFDAVYNHTALTEQSNFNQLVPGYYYRHKKDARPDPFGGSFSNATACGNETASEMPMMRKFMLESVLYWAKEYHIDLVSWFDLMGGTCILSQ